MLGNVGEFGGGQVSWSSYFFSGKLFFNCDKVGGGADKKCMYISDNRGHKEDIHLIKTFCTLYKPSSKTFKDIVKLICTQNLR